MNGKKGTFCYVLIILAFALAALLLLNKPAAAADEMSSLFSPPLTNREIAEYKKLGNDKKKIEKFIETRLFMRKVASYKSELPKGLEFDPNKHGSPQPSKLVDMEYALTFDEQLDIFSICLKCGGCGEKEENNPTGDPDCGLNHPKTIDCGKPADRNSVLSQLTPPASQDEIRLFEKANKCPSPEMPRFLATRKYMRQIDKIKAALPPGKAFDPRTAPTVPNLVDGSYFLNDESMLMLDIQHAQLMEILEQKR